MATILTFRRSTGGIDLATVGSLLSDTFAPPPTDAELDLLLKIAGKLVDNHREYEQPDCWIVRQR